MKVISTRNKYEIYDDTLKIYNELPVCTYIVQFSKMTGFYLEKFDGMEVKESKIYGVHLNKVKKVIRSFKDEYFNRNLGVMLSGDKGIGKSLFAKVLASKAIEANIPVIIVDAYYPGIASFISDITQEVMVLFDEFDKTFSSSHGAKNSEGDPQVELLTLFDGVVSGGKKLFVITCNELYHINDYLVNRPGRFHYHFRFEYPNANEIREYLTDKLDEQYHSEISKVMAFAQKINLNYDCLRAIAYEINQGELFKDAIKDLNIIKMRDTSYDISLHFKNGEPHTTINQTLDFFGGEDSEYVCLYNRDDDNCIDVLFRYEDCQTSPVDGSIVVPKEKIKLFYTEDKGNNEETKLLEVDYLSIKKCRSRSLHFSV